MANLIMTNFLKQSQMFLFKKTKNICKRKQWFSPMWHLAINLGQSFFKTTISRFEDIGKNLSLSPTFLSL